MTTSAIAWSVLVPGAEELASSAPIVSGEVKVYPVAKRPGVTLMCLAFDAGAILPSHIARGPIIIHTVSGEVKVEVEGQGADLAAGGVMHIDARVDHALRAPVRSRVLLTLLEMAGGGEPEVPGILKKASAPEAAPLADGANLLPVKDVSGQGALGGGCGCGEEDEDLPELDVRSIPHAIRHATVIGALQGLPGGAAMALVAHHNPLPLLRQIDELFDGAIEVTYLEEGPDVWKLRMLHIR